MKSDGERIFFPFFLYTLKIETKLYKEEVERRKNSDSLVVWERGFLLGQGKVE